MAERGIIFSAPMVRALLDGRKTQTRRVVKPQPIAFQQQTPDRHEQKHPAPYIDAYCSEPKTPSNPRGMSDRWCWWTRDDRQGAGWFRCPYGQPGDRLWVRETCMLGAPGTCPGANSKDAAVYCPATESDAAEAARYLGIRKTTPSIHMPRWASRITLEIESVRVERLQDISEEDARAEGVDFAKHADLDPPAGSLTGPVSARVAFSLLWDSIHGPGAWQANPWVWAINFRRIGSIGGA